MKANCFLLVDEIKEIWATEKTPNVLEKLSSDYEKPRVQLPINTEYRLAMRKCFNA